MRDATQRLTGVPGPVARIAQALYDGYRASIDRMTAECSDLGAHGIVGAKLQVTETAGDRFASATVEFKGIGTAVRAKGRPPLPRPFTTELSGPDFAKLLAGGWVPAGIALGISVARTARQLGDYQLRYRGHWKTRRYPTTPIRWLTCGKMRGVKWGRRYGGWALMAPPCPQ